MLYLVLQVECNQNHNDDKLVCELTHEVIYCDCNHRLMVHITVFAVLLRLWFALARLSFCCALLHIDSQ